MISITVESQLDEPPPLPTEQIVSLAETVLSAHGAAGARAQFVFVSDDYLRELKGRYFGQAVYTDVIAFNLNDPGEALEGEVYISSARAFENSQDYGEPYERELQRLVIHGTLHLLGFHDNTSQEQARMQAQEERFLGPLEDANQP